MSTLVYSRTFIRRRVFVFCPQVLLIGSGDYGCRGKKHGIVSAEVCMSFEAFRNFSMCIYAIQCRVVHSEYISKLGNQARHNACRSIVYNTIQKLYLNSVHDKQYKHKLYWAFETDKNKTYIIQYYSLSASCEPESGFWICHCIQDGPLFLGVSQWLRSGVL
jgi:hypothetical protein